MFDISFIGVPITLVGIAFIMLTSRLLLPDPRKTDITGRFKRRYRAEFMVSPLLNGRTLAGLGFLEAEGLELLELRRGHGDSSAEPRPDTRLQAGDSLVFVATFDLIPTLWDTNGLEPVHTIQRLESERFSHRLVEVVVSPQCEEIGRQIKELPLPGSPVPGIHHRVIPFRPAGSGTTGRGSHRARR